jgi:hypothetical protein
MGNVCLQLAPPLNDDKNNSDESSVVDFSNIPDPRMGTMRTVAQGERSEWEQFQDQQQTEKLERAKIAKETAEERGLELPPHLKNPSDDKAETPEDVGKGLFDGW